MFGFRRRAAERGAPNETIAIARAAYPKDSSGTPTLAHVPVEVRSTPGFDQLRGSDASEVALVQVVHFPGGPDLTAWAFQAHPMPAARDRRTGHRPPGMTVLVQQTGETRYQAELEAAELPPEGRLEIFEGLAT